MMIGIFLIILLLSIVAVDSAEDVINITNVNHKNVSVNDTYVNLQSNYSSNITGTAKDTVHKVYPTISMWAKPSVKCGYPYKWYYRTFIDYCPNCHHYNCLLKNPKSVPENEYTCAICDSDFDGVIGKEKYSWSNVYLIRA